jgi:kinesin family protein C2/C3
VTVSVLEIYNEKIRDLLLTERDIRKLEETAEDGSGTGGGQEKSRDLDIRIGKNGVFVEGLRERTVRSLTDVQSLISLANSNRQTASNNVNEHSSRSHLVVIVNVTCEDNRTKVVTRGQMYLIDLAGSEVTPVSIYIYI